MSIIRLMPVGKRLIPLQDFVRSIPVPSPPNDPPPHLRTGDGNVYLKPPVCQLQGCLGADSLYLEAKGIRRVHGAGSEDGPSILPWLKSLIRTQRTEASSQKDDPASFASEFQVAGT